MVSRLLRLIYGIYASVTMIIVIFVLFCPLIIIAPTLTWRRSIGRVCVRAALLGAFVPFRIRGLDNLPAGNCVVVANHSSFLDGLVLTSALPHRFTFMVKQGAASWPYIGLVIKRMGVRFVNRDSKREGARQTLRLIRDLKQDTSLAVFAEGTFQPEEGLMPFKRGAFTIAAKAGVPVVPVAIRGTRRLWGASGLLLRWTVVEVDIMAPITAVNASPESVKTLCDGARAQILAVVGEPDLASP